MVAEKETPLEKALCREKSPSEGLFFFRSGFFILPDFKNGRFWKIAFSYGLVSALGLFLALFISHLFGLRKEGRELVALVYLTLFPTFFSWLASKKLLGVKSFLHLLDERFFSGLFWRPASYFLAVSLTIGTICAAIFVAILLPIPAAAPFVRQGLLSIFTAFLFLSNFGTLMIISLVWGLRQTLVLFRFFRAGMGVWLPGRGSSEGEYEVDPGNPYSAQQSLRPRIETESGVPARICQDLYYFTSFGRLFFLLALAGIFLFVWASTVSFGHESWFVWSASFGFLAGLVVYIPDLLVVVRADEERFRAMLEDGKRIWGWGMAVFVDPVLKRRFWKIVGAIALPFFLIIFLGMWEVPFVAFSFFGLVLIPCFLLVRSLLWFKFRGWK